MRTALVAVGAALLVALAGCSTTATTTAAAPATTAAATTAAAAPAAATQADGSASHPLAFGATHHGQSLDVTVSAPKAFHASDSAFTEGHGRDVAVTITMANHAGQAFTPLGELTVTATAGSAEAEEIDDSANAIGEPEADILPGHSLTWRHGFVVPAGAKTLTISIGTLAAQGGIYYSGPVG